MEDSGVAGCLGFEVQQRAQQRKEVLFPGADWQSHGQAADNNAPQAAGEPRDPELPSSAEDGLVHCAALEETVAATPAPVSRQPRDRNLVDEAAHAAAAAAATARGRGRGRGRAGAVAEAGEVGGAGLLPTAQQRRQQRLLLLQQQQQLRRVRRVGTSQLPTWTSNASG
jgi:hypothetical protein